MPNDNDTLRDHLERIRAVQTPKRTAARKANARKASAARRGRPATIGVKRLLRYADWISSDYPNIAADLRQIAAGQDGDELWINSPRCATDRHHARLVAHAGPEVG